MVELSSREAKNNDQNYQIKEYTQEYIKREQVNDKLVSLRAHV